MWISQHLARTCGVADERESQDHGIYLITGYSLVCKPAATLAHSSLLWHTSQDLAVVVGGEVSINLHTDTICWILLITEVPSPCGCLVVDAVA